MTGVGPDDVADMLIAYEPVWAIGTGHVATPEHLSELAERLGVEEKLVAEIGGVVGSHVGPGAYGVAHL